MGRVIAAAVAAAFLLGAGCGYWLRGLQDKAATADEAKTEAKAEVKQAERASDAVQTNAAAEAKTEIRYVYVTKEVETLVDRPVYRNVCLDDDGLRAINSQILGFDTGGTGQAVPDAGTAARNDGG